MFLRGCLVAGVPLLLVWLPLLAHRSVAPVWGGYSLAYLVALVAGATAIVALALAVGAACRRTKSLFPAIGLALVVVASGLLAALAEVVLTHRLRSEDAFAAYAAWGHERSMLFAFEAQPNHEWENAGARYSTDRFGFRSHARGPWDATARTRIFTVGESSVFGYGLNDDETWPHRLEGRLRERLGDPSLVVVNAGNNGHTSLQTMFRFYTKVVPQKPTHVIAYVGPNDVYASEPGALLITKDILYSRSIVEYWAAEAAGKNPYVRSLLFYGLQRALPALSPVARREIPAVTQPVIYGQAQADDIAARYAQNIRMLCRMARADGIEPIVVTYMHDLPAAVPFPPLALRTMNARLRAFAAEDGIRLVDVEAALGRLPERARYFFDDHYHPSRDGAELIAATLADAWPSSP